MQLLQRHEHRLLQIQITAIHVYVSLWVCARIYNRYGKKFKLITNTSDWYVRIFKILSVMYNRDNIVLRERGKANIPFKILDLLWSCGKCLNRSVQDSRMLSQLALFLHSKILHINCFQRSPMSLNSHWNDSRHVPLDISDRENHPYITAACSHTCCCSLWHVDTGQRKVQLWAVPLFQVEMGTTWKNTKTIHDVLDNYQSALRWDYLQAIIKIDISTDNIKTEKSSVLFRRDVNWSQDNTCRICWAMTEIPCYLLAEKQGSLFRPWLTVTGEICSTTLFLFSKKGKVCCVNSKTDDVTFTSKGTKVWQVHNTLCLL